MKYIEYTFRTRDLTIDPEVLIAFLSEAGYEGFHETDEKLTVYINEDQADEDALDQLLSELIPGEDSLTYSRELIPDKNWNSEWEQSFSPILIDDRVQLRASFHEKETDIPYDILIDPKMSFGTGHHQTTRLMIRAMLEMDLKAKKVLDMGSGTGVLAILASLMGSSTVLAVDIDEWAFNNCIENVAKNSCSNIRVVQGDAKSLEQEGDFDIVLANINRNILLEDMPVYFEHMAEEGCLLLSGILLEDEQIISLKARESGFSLMKKQQEEKWLSLLFVK